MTQATVQKVKKGCPKPAMTRLSQFHTKFQEQKTIVERNPGVVSLRIVGGQSCQSFGHLIEIKLRVDVV